MGHYASEMMCDKCGNLRCTCPPPPDKTKNHWVVAEDYTVMRAKDYEASKGVGGLAYMARVMRKHHKNRADAEAEALQRCEAAVEAAREQLTRLKKTLKVVRPWEAK